MRKKQKRSMKPLVLILSFAMAVGAFAIHGAPAFASTWWSYTTTTTTTTTYKVQYYMQSTSGYYYLSSTSTGKCAVGKTVCAPIRSYSGYRCNYSRCRRTGKAKANKVLVLKVYYVKCAPATTAATTCRPVPTTCAPVTTTCRPVATTCRPVATTCRPVATTCKPAACKKVKYIIYNYKQTCRGSQNYRLAAIRGCYASAGTTVYASLQSWSGYTVNYSNPCTVRSGVVKSNGTLILKLYYNVL